MSVWIENGEKQNEIELRLYAPELEMIRLTFNPLKMSEEPNWNPQWEEWTCYATPLVIYKQDYEILLKDYFDKMYPTKDAFDGTPELCFDICFYNWLGTDDWMKVISEIENDLDSFQPDRKQFYIRFLSWIKEALKHTAIIVVEGNQ